MTRYIILHKSARERIVLSAISWGFLCGSIWFNYTFIGGSYFMNAIILIAILIWAVVQPASASFTSKEKAIDYIKGLKE